MTPRPGRRPGPVSGHLWWAWLSLALALPLGAQSGPAAAGARVAGTVLHGLTGAPVAEAEVAFLLPGEDGRLEEIVRQPVDADGRFAFTGPFLTAGQSFVLVAFYRGVPYPTATLEVGQQDGVLLEVYEPGDRADAIAIIDHHHFLSVDEGGVEAAQLINVENGGETAYVGHGNGPDRHVMELFLPAGLIELQDHNSALHRAAAGHYFDTQPLVPGTTQIAFSFRLPTEDFEGTYVHQVVYPTRSLDFYVQPPSINPGPPFEDLGPVQVHDRHYRHLRLRDLKPGQVVRLPLPVERPVRWMIKWAVLALGLVAGLAATLLVAGRGAASTAAAAPTSASTARRAQEARRQAILDELASLDDTQAGRREELMNEAVSLYRALERPR